MHGNQCKEVLYHVQGSLGALSNIRGKGGQEETEAGETLGEMSLWVPSFVSFCAY
jgi:hypothetical protein